MPTRKKSRPQLSRVERTPRRPTTPPVAINDPDAPVWGAAAIGAVIGRSERSTYHLLENGSLKGAKKISGIWSAIPSVLRAQWSASEVGGEQ